MLRSLIAFVVHRRMVALCATLAIAVFGVYAYLHTAIEAYPDVTNVQVGVIAQAPGLAPEEVERQITQPLERALNGTPGLASLRSESYFGLAMVNLVFDDHAKSFTARAEVAQRLPQADLPEGVTPEMAPDYTPLGKISTTSSKAIATPSPNCAPSKNGVWCACSSKSRASQTSSALADLSKSFT